MLKKVFLNDQVQKGLEAVLCKSVFRSTFLIHIYCSDLKKILTPYLFLMLCPILSSFFGESKQAELETLVDCSVLHVVFF